MVAPLIWPKRVSPKKSVPPTRARTSRLAGSRTTAATAPMPWPRSQLDRPRKMFATACWAAGSRVVTTRAACPAWDRASSQKWGATNGGRRKAPGRGAAMASLAAVSVTRPRRASAASSRSRTALAARGWRTGSRRTGERGNTANSAASAKDTRSGVLPK
jgi:hypothetical protein